MDLKEIEYKDELKADLLLIIKPEVEDTYNHRSYKEISNSLKGGSNEKVCTKYFTFSIVGFHGMPFSTGLRLYVATGNNASLTVIYE